MKDFVETVELWFIMVIIIAMIPTVAAVTYSEQSDNGSEILSDTLSLTAAPSSTVIVPSDVAGVASDATSLHQNAVNQATKLVGTGYLWGGKGFDYQTMKYARLKRLHQDIPIMTLLLVQTRSEKVLIALVL